MYILCDETNRCLQKKALRRWERFLASAFAAGDFSAAEAEDRRKNDGVLSGGSWPRPRSGPRLRRSSASRKAAAFSEAVADLECELSDWMMGSLWAVTENAMLLEHFRAAAVGIEGTGDTANMLLIASVRKGSDIEGTWSYKNVGIGLSWIEFSDCNCGSIVLSSSQLLPFESRFYLCKKCKNINDDVDDDVRCCTLGVEILLLFTDNIPSDFELLHESPAVIALL